MKNYSVALMLALILGGASAVAADLTGRVVLKGPIPKEVEIKMTTDPRCAALHTKPVFTRFYETAADGGLADVLVYVKSGLPEREWPMPTEKMLLDQVDCEYIPYVAGVRAGQTISIRNSDPTLHNVNATPKINKGFNFAQPVKGMVTEKVFDLPEVPPIRFRCDVHPWMFAYVGVFEHPFFAVTDEKGNFKISGLPDGKYTLVAYHRRTHTTTEGITQEVTVDGDTKVEFVVELK
jgi:hypothetical protein